MEKKRKGITSVLFGAGGLYIASALAVLAVCAVGYAVLFPAQEAPAQSDLSPAVPDMALSEDIPQDISRDPLPTEPTEPAVPTVQSLPPQLPEVSVEPQAPTVVVKPLEGQVVAAFSMDTLMYDVTMDDWRVHNGIDISADPGTEVLCACSGTVLSVTNDALMGISVTVEGDDGYVATYANLAPDPIAAAGDILSAGDVIGLVGATSKAESAAPPHLHFSVSRDGEAVDPVEYLS